MTEVRTRELVNPRIQECEFTISRMYPSMPGFQSLPWRDRIAWRLRFWADKLDRGLSYRMRGKVPAGLEDQDLFDGMCFGATAMQGYWADIQSERRIER